MALFSASSNEAASVAANFHFRRKGWGKNTSTRSAATRRRLLLLLPKLAKLCYINTGTLLLTGWLIETY